MPKNLEQIGSDPGANEHVGSRESIVSEVYKRLDGNKTVFAGAMVVAAAVATRGESLGPVLKGAGKEAIVGMEELAAGASKLLRGSNGVAMSAEVRASAANIGTLPQELGGKSAADNLLSQIRAASDVRSFGAAGKELSAAGHSPSAFSAFDRSGYKWVPAREFANSVRLAEGPPMYTVNGPSRIIFGQDNAIKQIHFSSTAGEAEKADLILQAGYAGLIRSDVEAAAAAAKYEGQSIGFVSQKIERWATPEQMQENALKGARAYLDGDANAANKFTEYLTERYGPMNSETRDWGRHIVSDTGSPESVWSHQFAPATEALVQNGIPIKPGR